MKYKYLVIEGNIGAGKTSLASRLAEETGSRLVLEAFSDNPFLAKFYEDPDRYAFQLELSFLSERYHQIKTELGHPDLFGQAVISDYFLAKSFIFSKYNLKDDEMKLFEKLFSIINLQAPKPDLYVYLHLPVEKLLQNIERRGRSYEKHIKYEYHANLIYKSKGCTAQDVFELSKAMAKVVLEKFDLKLLDPSAQSLAFAHS